MIISTHRPSLFSGPDYWTHKDSGNEQEYTEIRQCHAEYLASLPGLLRSSIIAPVQVHISNCIGNQKLEPVILGMRLSKKITSNPSSLFQRQNLEQKTSVNYNWRQAMGSTFSIHNTKKKTALRTGKEHPATLEPCITHALHMQFIV